MHHYNTFDDSDNDDIMNQNNIISTSPTKDVYKNFARSSTFAHVGKGNVMTDMSRTGKVNEAQKWIKSKKFEFNTEPVSHFTQNKLQSMKLADFRKLLGHENGLTFFRAMQTMDVTRDDFRFIQASKEYATSDTVCKRGGMVECKNLGLYQCSSCNDHICIQHSRKRLLNSKQYCEACFQQTNLLTQTKIFLRKIPIPQIP